MTTVWSGMMAMKMWAKCGSLMVVATTVAGCATLGFAGSGTGSGTSPYASVTELAHALRNQQVTDGTMSFETKLTLSDAPGRSINGSGKVRASNTETDFQQSIDGNGSSGDAGASMIILGTSGFGKSGAPESPSPWSVVKLSDFGSSRTTLEIFTANMLYFTQLDGSSDAFTLAGSSAVLGPEGDTEYRLTADEAAASTLAFRHAGIPVAATNQGAHAQMGLNLTLDGRGQLKAAHWQLSTEGKVLNIDYLFSKWGALVDIAAPAVK